MTAAAPSPTDRSTPGWPWLLLLAAAAALGWAMLHTAWLGDDAHITFRTAENFCQGHGLRWNTDERVQTYTHPLWLLLLCAQRALGGDWHRSVLWLSLGLSAAAVAVLGLGLRLRPLAAALLLLVLASSRAFVDYCTSGLETPLTHLLLAALAVGFLRLPPGRGRVLGCAVLTGLLLTNRMDLLWVCLPPLVAAARQAGLRRSCWPLLLGLSPFVLWVLFATVYYGTPFPSTAYSKAFATGISAVELARQGLRYCADLVLRDPTTALVVAAGPLALLLPSLRSARPLLLGALLHLLYVVKVGGDFMAGRFFTPAFVVTVAALAHAAGCWPLRRAVAAALVAVLVAFAAGTPLWLRGPGVDPQPSPEDLRWGIGDERGYYWEFYGLLAPNPRPPIPGVFSAAQRQAGSTQRWVELSNVVGVRAFLAGDLVHVVDQYLCDPLLVRLPIDPRREWRIGHFQRHFPEGLLESIARDDNRIVHPGLAELYGDIRAVTRGPLWSWARLAAAWRLHTGAHAAGVADYVATDYATPPAVLVPAAALDRQVAPGTPWFGTDARVLLEGGIDAVFDAPQRAARVTVMVDGGDHYRLEFRAGARVLWQHAGTAPRPAYGGLDAVPIELPEAAQGFDRIAIRAAAGVDGVAAVGSLRLQD